MPTPASPNRIGNQQFVALGNVDIGLTAKSGGGQTGALALLSQLNIVSTVAAGNDSVALPKISANPVALGGLFQMIVVRNSGANSMQVFGASPDTINDVATATGVAVGSGKTAMFFATAFDPTTNVGKWYMLLSA